MSGIAKLLSATNACVSLTLKTRYLAGHIPCRYVQEFPETRFNNATPKDYLLILPEKSDESDNEAMRLPQRGEPEIDFSKLNTEVCFKGLSMALCTFENFLTDVNNQVSSPYNNVDELFRDIEKHLVPLDFTYNILMLMRTIHSEDYAYREIQELIKRYYEVREKRCLGTFRDALRVFSHDKSLSLDAIKMMRLYHVNPRLFSSRTTPLDDSFMHHLKKNLNTEIGMFNQNLQAANQAFTHTIDDPDILSTLSRDRGSNQDLHHKERTPLQITTSTYHRFMQICPDRFIRQRMWQTFHKRCSPKGSPRCNNVPVIKNIRVLKRKLADLNGYRSHLDYRLEDTMAYSRQRVMDCLQTVNKENLPKLHDRLQELTEFAYDNKHEDPAHLGLQEYDIDYWSNRYVHDILIGIGEAQLREFFPLKTVMNGIGDYFNKFFAIDMKPTNSDNFWSKHVQKIEFSRKGQPLGIIIYDPVNRLSTTPYHSVQARLRQRVKGSNHLPAQFMSTPFKLECGEAYLTVKEVMDLFYLFSVNIQRLLHNFQYYELNTYGAPEPDVKDLLPNLCLAHLQSDHRILQSCSSRTGNKPIDTDLTTRILKAVTYFNPFYVGRELYLSHLDQEAHILLTDTKTLADEIYAKYLPLQRDPDNYDFCAMNQIFVGPNDGLQYSDLWSRQVANFCMAHSRDKDGTLDEVKFKEILNKLVDSLYVSDKSNTDEKLTAIVGKRFEPLEAIPGVL